MVESPFFVVLNEDEGYLYLKDLTSGVGTKYINVVYDTLLRNQNDYIFLYYKTDPEIKTENQKRLLSFSIITDSTGKNILSTKIKTEKENLFLVTSLGMTIYD